MIYGLFSAVVNHTDSKGRMIMNNILGRMLKESVVA
jgi:hypothetical protein